MLYPNFHTQTSFSTNHLGSGEHIKSAGGDADHLPIDYTVPLVEDWSSLFDQLPGSRLPHLDDLVGMDLLGKFQGIHEFTKHFSVENLQQQTGVAAKEATLAAKAKKKNTARQKGKREKATTDAAGQLEKSS
mmetsp:Transcript_38398/g.62899  ORF Transcript_38398/g.62899 Transcript_38398/m.62899 type:complete len:132 (-) Transcript_38398:221-616(-)